MIVREPRRPLWRVALVVLSTVAVLGVAPVEVDAQESADAADAVARIVARRHGDGRVEFAVQQQVADGSWGERLLPARRFFPITAAVGRWLISTPLELAGDVVARIVARRHGDGRVEFAVQQQVADGSWGERLLPARRFFPTTAAVGRWLVSTPLDLFSAPGGTALPPAMDTPPDEDTPPAENAPPEETPPGEPPPEETPPGEPPPEEPASPAARFAAHLVEGVNAARPDSWETLVLDAGLSAVAGEKAQAMADTGTWRYDFDFVNRLEPGWDIWRIGRSVSADATLDHPDIPPDLAAALLGDGGDAQLACARCTHLGAGIATANVSTYATVIVAAAIPGEELTEAEMIAAEAEMAGLVNELRAFLDLDPLEHHSGVAASARYWSQRMGAEEDFRHNFNLGDRYPPGFFLATENIAAVKYSGDLSEAIRLSFGDFVNSGLHYQNMTQPALTHHGYGIVLKAGWVWITQNFAAYP